MLKRGLEYSPAVQEQRYGTDIELTSLETALELFLILPAHLAVKTLLIGSVFYRNQVVLQSDDTPLQRPDSTYVCLDDGKRVPEHLLLR